MLRIFLSLIFAFGSIRSESRPDSYLNAFKVTHNLNAHKRDAYEDMYPVYHQNHHQQQQQQHEHEQYPYDESAINNFNDYDYHGVPEEPQGKPHGTPQGLGDYYESGKPLATYGPPSNTNQKQIYGGNQVYGVPVPAYGPPFLQNNYHHLGHYHHFHHNGPSSSSSANGYIQPEPISEFIPHAFLTFWDKLKILKWDLFKIGKFLLAIVILKKFLSFITILFLLFIIPKFKHHKKKKNCDDDDCDRKVFDNKRLDSITQYVMDSIGKFDNNFRMNATVYKK